jgi:hypothetical protein
MRIDKLRYGIIIDSCEATGRAGRRPPGYHYGDMPLHAGGSVEKPRKIRRVRWKIHGRAGG